MLESFSERFQVAGKRLTCQRYAENVHRANVGQFAKLPDLYLYERRVKVTGLGKSREPIVANELLCYGHKRHFQPMALFNTPLDDQIH
jgi:hypothetical protein